jgi:hypothetical protein
MTDGPQVVVAYGALYLDKGERLPKADEQIAMFRDRHARGEHIVTGFGFDILYKRGQESMAKRYAEQIEQKIHDAFPQAGLTLVVSAELVKAGKDDGTRPAREWTVRALEGSGDDYLAELAEQTEPGRFIRTDVGSVEQRVLATRRTWVEQALPEFTKALAKCREEKIGQIIMTIDAFAPTEDADLLHAALHVAYADGVAVMFAPAKSTGDPKSAVGFTREP